MNSVQSKELKHFFYSFVQYRNVRKAHLLPKLTEKEGKLPLNSHYFGGGLSGEAI